MNSNLKALAWLLLGLEAGCDEEKTDTGPGNEADADTDVDSDVDTDVDVYWHAGDNSLFDAQAKLVGEAEMDQVGYAIAGGGDVNGDGRPDVLVGAGEESSGGGDAGSAYLLLSPLRGEIPLAAADAKLIGRETYGEAGGAVCIPGDIEGDGLADLVVGAGGPGGDSKVYVVFGPVTGHHELSSSDAILNGADWETGRALAAVGDVDGNGTADFLVDAEETDWLITTPVSGAGSIDDMAQAKLLPETRDWWPGHKGDWLWNRDGAVAGPGDMDGDGIPELLVGTGEWYENDLSETGVVYVLSGDVSGTVDLGSDCVRLLGEDGDWLGWALAAPGDVDADGHADFLACAGDRACLVFGPVSSSGVISELETSQISGKGYAPYDISAAGDVDADGFDDFLVGDWSMNTAYLFLGPVSGAQDLEADSFAVFNGESDKDRASCGMAWGGDIDGNGSSDFLIGAAGEDSGADLAGAAYLLLSPAP